MTLQAGISLRRNERRVGTTEKVLVTDAGQGEALGRSEREAPETDGEIRFTTDRPVTPGAFVQVKLTRAETYDLSGVLAGTEDKE